MNQSQVLKFFKDKRDVNIHVEPVPLRADIAIHATGRIHLSGSLSIAILKEGRVVGQYDSPPSPPEAKRVEDDQTTITRVYKFTDWAPAALGGVARLEGVDQVVDQTEARVRGGGEALRLPLDLDAQHVLRDLAVRGPRGPVAHAAVGADPLEPPDLPAAVHVAFGTPSATLALHSNAPWRGLVCAAWVTKGRPGPLTLSLEETPRKGPWE
jgi:hypothetical protein